MEKIMEGKRETYSTNRQLSPWQISATDVADQLSIYHFCIVTLAPKQSEKFVMLNKGGNLVSKAYHQRQDDYLVFQMYDPSGPILKDRLCLKRKLESGSAIR